MIGGKQMRGDMADSGAGDQQRPSSKPGVRQRPHEQRVGDPNRFNRRAEACDAKRSERKQTVTSAHGKCARRFSLPHAVLFHAALLPRVTFMAAPASSQKSPKRGADMPLAARSDCFASALFSIAR